MNQRIREILDYLVDIILRSEDVPDSEIALVERLVKQGYHIKDIDTALDVIFSLPVKITIDEIVSEGRSSSKHSSRRILSPMERIVLTRDAQGMLIRLVDHGLLKSSELEEVLAEALELDVVELGVSELLVLLMRIIHDEDRLAMVASYWNEVSGGDGGRENLN